MDSNTVNENDVNEKGNIYDSSIFSSPYYWLVVIIVIIAIVLGSIGIYKYYKNKNGVEMVDI